MPTDVIEVFPTSTAFAESSTGRIGGQLKDEDAANITLSAVTALVGTLTNHLGAVVNSRSAQNMLNANNATVSADGAFVLELQVADTAAVEAGPEYQTRYLTLKGTHSGGKTLAKEIQFYIRKLHGHP
jgi:hypothetical protein